MLGYFPVPYQDELLYSLVARYAQHTGLVGNQKSIVREVFSSSTAVAVPDLPSHLSSLVNNLQLVWPTSVEELIDSFTLAPIYLPFLSQQQASKTIRSMGSDSNTATSASTKAFLKLFALFKSWLCHERVCLSSPLNYSWLRRPFSLTYKRC